MDKPLLRAQQRKTFLSRTKWRESACFPKGMSSKDLIYSFRDNFNERDSIVRETGTRGAENIVFLAFLPAFAAYILTKIVQEGQIFRFVSDLARERMCFGHKKSFFFFFVFFLLSFPIFFIM